MCEITKPCSGLSPFDHYGHKLKLHDKGKQLHLWPNPQKDCVDFEAANCVQMRQKDTV